MDKMKNHVEAIIVVMSLLAGLFFLDARDESRSDRLQTKMDIQSQRTDRLYEMFIELVKERK